MSAERIVQSFVALKDEQIEGIERLPGGSSLPSWHVKTASGRYAVRLYSDLRSAYGQARLLRHLAEAGFPVPEVILVGTHAAGHLLVLSWVKGVTVAEALQARPDHACQLGWAVGKVHAQLHTVPVTPELRAEFQTLASPNPVSPVLLHLDYHPKNVMTDGVRVTGVIDWQNVQLGDPRYDLARSVSVLCAEPNIRAFPPPLKKVIRDFRQGYCLGYGLTASDPFGTLAPFLAWSGEFMLRDMEERLTPYEAQQVRRWATHWTRS